MSPKSPNRPSSWLSPRELAAALNVRIDYARRKIIPSLPEEICKREGRRIMVNGRLAIEHYLVRRLMRQALEEARAEHESAEIAKELAYFELRLLQRHSSSDRGADLSISN
jgi:hypothetical protein